MPRNENNQEVLQIIETALELAGKGSRQIILDYLNARYGMNMKLITEYKDEFENYLHETLGDSAEIIISRINENLRSSNNNNNNNDDTSAAQGQKNRPHDRTQSGRRRITTNVVHFLICDRCFWCASILKEHYESKCMSCGSQIVSAVPVMRNEMFMVEVDKKRGISLSFH